MAKKELKMHAVVAPTETVVVSAFDKDGKAEACTLAFYMVSSHKTLASILENKAFVLSFPSADQVKEADYLGVESGYNTDKLANVGFTTTNGERVNAPIINEMKLSLECEVVHTVTVGSHIQVTGEVKRILADEDILNDKDKVVLEKLNPLIYDEEQVRYLKIGDTVADAFKTGAEFKKSLG